MDVKGIVDKFASKKFGMMALSIAAITYLTHGSDYVLPGILSIGVITAIYVWAVAHYGDNGG